MSEKRRSVRRIIDRLFPELAEMDDRLKPINNPETTQEERMLLVHNLLKQETPNLDALISERARRRRVRRGQLVEMGVGNWKICENDADLLFQAIKLRDYLYFRLGLMDNLKFARLCAKLDERQAPLDRIEHERVDATRFFSLPPAIMTAADWDYWLALATVTAEEAIALSLSKNPDVVCLASLDKERIRDNRPSPLYDEFALRLRAIQRAISSGLLNKSLDLQKFTAWAETSKFDLPTQLKGNRPAPRQNDVLVDEMEPKYRKSLRHLLLAMAVDKYGHKIGGNSTAITKIVTACLNMGIPIHRDTVKDALTDAAEDEALEEEVELLREHLRST